MYKMTYYIAITITFMTNNVDGQNVLSVTGAKALTLKGCLRLLNLLGKTSLNRKLDFAYLSKSKVSRILLANF